MSKIWLWLGAAALVVVIAIVAMFLFMGNDSGHRPVAATSAPGTASAPSRTAPGDGVALKPTDHVLGDPNAPITILDYSSLTCPHCAGFHIDVLPGLQKKYIDTGKVKLVYRDFPLDGTALRAATLAECVAPEKYYGFLTILFEGQQSWAGAQDPIAALSKLGKLSGLSEQAVADCFANEKLNDDVVSERLEGEQKYDVRSTPTFVIDGRTYSGALTMEQLDSILQPLVK